MGLKLWGDSMTLRNPFFSLYWIMLIRTYNILLWWLPHGVLSTFLSLYYCFFILACSIPVKATADIIVSRTLWWIIVSQLFTNVISSLYSNISQSWNLNIKGDLIVYKIEKKSTLLSKNEFYKKSLNGTTTKRRKNWLGQQDFEQAWWFFQKISFIFSKYYRFTSENYFEEWRGEYCKLQ